VELKNNKKVYFKMEKLPLNQIIHGDCLKFMKTLPDNCIDLVITDPPYGDNIVYGRNFKKILNNENENINYKFLEIIYSKMKNNTSLYLFSNWKFETLLRNWIKTYSNFTIRMVIIIVKNNISMGYSFRNQYEICLVLEKGKPKYNLKNFSNVMFMEHIKHTSKTHPHTKTLNILEQMIKHSSKKDDLVFDAFVGGGSTIAACIRTNRNYIGIELDNKWFNLIKKNINKFKGQKSLF
jgi:site-specific DNA-methyltransferase (adenine-specific)